VPRSPQATCGPYLAWLAGYGTRERDEYAFDREDDELEPPVPRELAALTASQQALADFLHLDDDLLNLAATTSPPLEDAANDPRELARWITNLALVEKDRLLLRVIRDNPATVRTELLRRFRDQTMPAVPSVPRRTVADLLDAVARMRANASAEPLPNVPTSKTRRGSGAASLTNTSGNPTPCAEATSIVANCITRRSARSTRAGTTHRADRATAHTPLASVDAGQLIVRAEPL
jgi:hypothetical protein